MCPALGPIITGRVPWQLNASESLKEWNPVGVKGEGNSNYLTAASFNHAIQSESTSSPRRLADTVLHRDLNALWIHMTSREHLTNSALCLMQLNFYSSHDVAPKRWNVPAIVTISSGGFNLTWRDLRALTEALITTQTHRCEGAWLACKVWHANWAVQWGDKHAH